MRDNSDNASSIIKFTIPGHVKAKERPRLGKWGNFYTPKTTKDFERLVAIKAIEAGIGRIKGSIAVSIKFYGKYGRSDIDNLSKSVLDGLKKHFNDNKVDALMAIKKKSNIEKTEVRIWNWED